MFHEAPIERGLHKSLQKGDLQTHRGFMKPLQTGALQSPYREETLHSPKGLQNAPVERGLQKAFQSSFLKPRNLIDTFIFVFFFPTDVGLLHKTHIEM